jgi:hypothetical protein
MEATAETTAMEATAEATAAVAATAEATAAVAAPAPAPAMRISRARGDERHSSGHRQRAPGAFADFR